MKLVEGGSEEVVEIEAVGLAVVGVEAGIAGEVAEDMQLNPSGEVGGYVSEAGGAHEGQCGAKSDGVANCGVSKAPNTAGGESALEGVLIGDEGEEVVVEK